MKHWRMGFAALVIAGLAACSTTERTPSHPNYAAAISDLRIARSILNREAEYAAIRDQYRALESIDRAVLALKDAAIEGGQPLGAPPTIDPALDYGGRLSRAHELILGADNELRFREDDARARPARDEARDHVDDALHAVERTIAQEGTSGSGSYGGGANSR